MDTGKVHIFTLDSHDYFGPFESEEQAHDWAKGTRKSSYELTTRVGWHAEVIKPYDVAKWQALHGEG